MDQGKYLRNGHIGVMDRAANLVVLVTNKVVTLFVCFLLCINAYVE